MRFEVKGEKERITPTDETNPYWVAFKNAMDTLLVYDQLNEREHFLQIQYSISVVFKLCQIFALVHQTADLFAEFVFYLNDYIN